MFVVIVSQLMAVLLVHPAAAFGPAPGDGWTKVAPMSTTREYFGLAGLTDGTALAAGGAPSYLPVSSAELFDPKTGNWTVTAAMTTARSSFCLVGLSDGTALAAGGYDGGTRGVLMSAELFDPKTGQWAAAADMSTARFFFGLAGFPDGTALAAGGCVPPCTYPSGPDLASAELFDPKTNTWHMVAAMTTPRHSFGLVGLTDGTALAAGGYRDNARALASAELFDPKAGRWVAVAPMTTARQDPGIAVLPDGKVLVAGGGVNDNNDNPAFQSAEFFDPGAGKWTEITPMTTPRYGFGLTGLPDGSALAAGGFDGTSRIGSAELFTWETPPCAPPTGSFRCVNSTCQDTGPGSGIPYFVCRANCGPMGAAAPTRAWPGHAAKK